MSDVTSPIITDATGQAILSKLNEIKQVLSTPSDAEDINYDNTTSGMTADNVQSAVDELKSNLTDLENYSTSEVAVGKWIDGTTTVYKKTFSFTTTGSTDQVLSIGSTITKLLAIEGGLNYTSGSWYAPQTYFSTNDQFTVWVTNNNTEIKIRSGTINGRDGWVTIYYTK